MCLCVVLLNKILYYYIEFMFYVCDWSASVSFIVFPFVLSGAAFLGCIYGRFARILSFVFEMLAQRFYCEKVVYI